MRMYVSAVDKATVFISHHKKTGHSRKIKVSSSELCWCVCTSSVLVCIINVYMYSDRVCVSIRECVFVSECA